MSVSIRRLLPDDWALVKTIRLKALQTNPGVFGGHYADEVAKSDDQWRAQMENRDCAVFGVFDDDAVIGMTGIVIDRDDPARKKAYLWGSWLAPEWRGKGISRLMYEARLAWAREHPTCEKLVVSHRASNLTSMRANQRYGFKQTHVVEKQWPDGGVEEDIFYELRVKS